MTKMSTLRGLLAAVALSAAAPALAQDNAGLMTADEVRAEVSEAMNAIEAYTEQERDEAIAAAGEALDNLDDEIERREQALRENWAQMSDAARETARARLRDLRDARNALGERYGALQTGTSDAWDELLTGFSNAWSAFSDAWNSADEEAPAD
jgi:TolA-binding protein